MYNKNSFRIVKQGFRYYVVGPVGQHEELPVPLPYPDNFLSAYTKKKATEVQQHLERSYKLGYQGCFFDMGLKD